MKKCSICKLSKELDKFSSKDRKKGTRQSYCKECWNKKNKERYENNKQYYIDKATKQKQKVASWFASYKSTLCCQKCGFSHVAALHFHHRNTDEKDIEISRAVINGWPIKKVLEEITKCDVLCANCHAILHYEEKFS